jgi:hypothetical protein
VVWLIAVTLVLASSVLVMKWRFERSAATATGGHSRIG